MEKLPKNENMRGESEAVHERIDELKRKVAEHLGGIEYNKVMLDFATKLEERHPGARKYRVFHQLIGSTPLADVLSGDFEGEDSIEAFFKSLAEEK